MEGRCAVGAIGRQLAVLRSAPGPRQRLQALKYIVHLVADLHQPLHAGYADDRGGNLYQVQAFGRGTNLHALWDVALLENRPGGVEALRRTLTALRHEAATGSAQPAQWAEASCRIVATDGFYPNGHKIDAAYAVRWDLVLTQQIEQSARHLAAALNGALDDR